MSKMSQLAVLGETLVVVDVMSSASRSSPSPTRTVSFALAVGC